MKKTLITILLILTNYCFGQNPDKQVVIERTENLNWVENLEKINSKAQRIQIIIEKIKRDSIVEFKNADRIVVKLKEGENVNDAINRQSNCKVLFVLNQKKVGYLLDLNQYPNYSDILKYLTSDSINSIEILKGEKATSIYGSRASCGVIILKSEDKKLRKLLRKRAKKTTA